MVTVPEAARRLGRNPETIRRWIREGRLRSTKVGTQYLLDEQDLEHFGDAGEIIPSVRDAQTATGEPMPDFLAALRRSRTSR